MTGLERLVEEQEADYIGKAHSSGSAPRRDPQAGRHGGRRRRARLGADPVLAREAEWDRVGHATVAIHSPGLKKNIGYVWVPIELAEPGKDLELELPDGSRRAARTAALPFIDPRKERPAA